MWTKKKKVRVCLSSRLSHILYHIIAISCLSHILLVFPKWNYFETCLWCRALNYSLERASGEGITVASSGSMSRGQHDGSPLSFFFLVLKAYRLRNATLWAALTVRWKEAISVPSSSWVDCKQQTLSSPSSGGCRSEIQGVPAWSGSGGGLFKLQIAGFSLCPHVGRGKRASFYKGTNPIPEGSTLIT